MGLMVDLRLVLPQIGGYGRESLMRPSTGQSTHPSQVQATLGVRIAGCKHTAILAGHLYLLVAAMRWRHLMSTTSGKHASKHEIMYEDTAVSKV